MAKRAKHRQPKGKAGARRRGKEASERPLTAMQERFCEEYAKGERTGKDAAERAGYSAKTADKQASQLLDNPRIADRVAELRGVMTEEAIIEGAQVVKEWARVGLSDVRDVLEVKGGFVFVKDSSEWPEDAARAVAEVSQTMTEDGPSIKVKLHSKLKALDSLGKYLGLLVERRELTGKDGGPIKLDGLSQDTAEKIRREILGVKDE